METIVSLQLPNSRLCFESPCCASVNFPNCFLIAYSSSFLAATKCNNGVWHAHSFSSAAVVLECVLNILVIFAPISSCPVYHYDLFLDAMISTVIVRGLPTSLHRSIVVYYQVTAD